jgi:hypothetical protein
MLFAYYFFPEHFQGYCSSTIECLITCVDQAFKSDGGLGGYLDAYEVPEDGDNPNRMMNKSTIKMVRFAFDNFYNVFVVIIMVSIVSGIIIDKFGEMREE